MTNGGRRRRGRRRSGGERPTPGAGQQAHGHAQARRDGGRAEGREPAEAHGARRKRRRRRGGGDGAGAAGASPASSEDLVRAIPRRRPEQLTAAPDGQVLEAIIGDLQSQYGVPQYPQEYRITIKVADGARTGEAPASEPATPSGSGEGSRREKAPAAPAAGSDGPRREKAPAAPRIGSTPSADGAGPAKPRRRRRRRGRGGGAKPAAE